MISFNKPPYTGKEIGYIREALHNQKISGDGEFTFKCSRWLEENLNVPKALLTTSCTHALEMTAILADIQPGDEVIAPSYTFVSTVNAFVLRGARIKFVDIRPDTMNIDEYLIEQAITSRTKAIVIVHYAGVACEMDTIMALAQQYNLLVIEDAAQAVMSRYKGRSLGAIGDMAAVSFHETKNYSMGEGGAILINDKKYIERAEIIREKGTNRSKFFRGEIDKYTWCDLGSSYLPSEINAAYLWSQFELAHEINNDRLKSWSVYRDCLTGLAQRGDIQLPFIPAECTHNGHIFYIKCNNNDTRFQLISALKQKKILATFHYVPLHKARAGLKYADFVGEDYYTVRESERLLRLPLYYRFHENDLAKVVEAIYAFYGVKA